MTKRSFPAPKEARPLLILDGTYKGLSGRPSPSGKRMLAPFGVQLPSGRYVTSFYDHYYRTEREHYHFSHEDLEKCQELYP